MVAVLIAIVAPKFYPQTPIIINQDKNGELGGTTSATWTAANLVSNGTLNVTGTTTMGVSYDGYVQSNSFTIATGTVAALSYQNTNGDMSCQGGAVELTHAGYVQAFQFAVGTSTTASMGISGGVIATTTVATTTTSTTNWYNIATPSTWEFPKDAYLNAAIYDNGHTGASSTAYANLSGKVRLSCWLNN